MDARTANIPGAGTLDIPTGDPSSNQHTRQCSRTTTGRDFHRSRTECLKRKTAIVPPADMRDHVLRVLEYLNQQDLNLPLLLWELFWTNDELYSDDKARYARTELMLSQEFEDLLQLWHKPSRTHNRGVKTCAAYEVMETFVCDTLHEEVDSEMKEVVREMAPTTWGLLRRASYTSRQESRNVMKNPNSAILMMISMAAYNRSHHACKLQKLNTIYSKSCGVGAKSFDTLNALSITMSQKWAYNGIEQLSAAARMEMLKLIELYPWYLAYDNLNIAYKTYEQRLDNQSRFESGTAGTVLIIKNPAAPARSILSNPRISTCLKSPFIRQRAVHRILRFLTETPAFNFQTYLHKDSVIFHRPPPIDPLPTGPEHAMLQFMLDTLDIEEASYEGNSRVLEAFFKQLRQNTTLEKQKRLARGDVVVVTGDQMTASRVRGLQVARSEDYNSYDRLAFIKPQFGWLHAQFMQEHSLHKQYYGTAAGFGLKQDFDLLKRKGLGAPSVKGTFHHDFQEALYHIGVAHFRDMWRVAAGVDALEDLRSHTPEQLRDIAVMIEDMEQQLPRLLFRYAGGNNHNYAIEILELLQLLQREGSEDLKLFIKSFAWLTNGTGHADSFYPIDELQEHNIRDIKVIFAVLGPFATWKYILALVGHCKHGKNDSCDTLHSPHSSNMIRSRSHSPLCNFTI
ncbi:hypothetical protein K474DRAFT_1677972 [Panus rudis PR-1116 ss-1]|nr:hypothetical protein K474DRAFT_1677972 [Panus rudis PR-1116 ss-1]